MASDYSERLSKWIKKINIIVKVRFVPFLIEHWEYWRVANGERERGVAVRESFCTVIAACAYGIWWMLSFQSWYCGDPMGVS